jgi:hypothetical protein
MEKFAKENKKVVLDNQISSLLMKHEAKKSIDSMRNI